jgi:hypothetical protein
MEGLPQFLAHVSQHPKVMDRVVPQDWSNMVWGIATLYEAAHDGGNQQLAEQLQQHGQMLLARLVQTPAVMQGAVSQNWSNSVWAAAKLGCVQEGAQLLSQLASSIHTTSEAKPQHWSNSVWAAATLYEAAVIAGDKQLAQRLQQAGRLLLEQCLPRWGALKGTVPQNWVNAVWAAAKLECAQEGAQLLCKLTSNLGVMKGAKPQEWSNTLWAAATLRLYHQDLFKRALQELAAMPLAATNAQTISNSLCACAVCAHWDSGVQQLLSRVRESDLAPFKGQDLGNNAWAWAVLACLAQEDGSFEQHEQCFQAAATTMFKEAALRPVNSFTVEGKQQLYQAHLFAGYLGIPGLPAGQVLQAATQAGLTVHTTSSRSQQEVNNALRQMAYTTQLEGLSPDGLMRADTVITALPDGSPCSIAVEYDGSFHYVTEHTASGASVDRLDGPTRLRNALLSRSFPDGLVCIYWRNWAAVARDKEASVEYLSTALAKVVR